MKHSPLNPKTNQKKWKENRIFKIITNRKIFRVSTNSNHLSCRKSCSLITDGVFGYKNLFKILKTGRKIERIDLCLTCLLTFMSIIIEANKNYNQVFVTKKFKCKNVTVAVNMSGGSKKDFNQYLVGITVFLN